MYCLNVDICFPIGSFFEFLAYFGRIQKRSTYLIIFLMFIPINIIGAFPFGSGFALILLAALRGNRFNP